MPEPTLIISDQGAAYKLFALRKAKLIEKLREKSDFKFDEKDAKALDELLGDDVKDVNDYIGGDAKVRASAILTQLNILLPDLKDEAELKPDDSSGGTISFEEAHRSKKKKKKGKIESPVSVIRRELNNLPDEQIAMLLFKTMSGLKNMQMLLSSDNYEEFKENIAQNIREQAIQLGEDKEAFLQQFKMFLGEDLISWPLSEESSELFEIFIENIDKGIKVDFINGVSSLEEGFPVSILNESLELKSKKEIANWIVQVGQLNQLLFNSFENPLPDDVAKLIDSFVREPIFNFNKDFMPEEAQERFKIHLVRTLKKGLGKFEPIVENLLLKDTDTTKKSISHLIGMNVDELIVKNTLVELTNTLGPMAALVLPFITSINEYIQTKTHEIVQEEISEEVRARLVDDFKALSIATEPTNLEECVSYLYKCKGFMEGFNEILSPVLDKENLVPKLLAKIAEEPFFKQLAPLLQCDNGNNAEELIKTLIASITDKADSGKVLSSLSSLFGMVPSGEDETFEDGSTKPLVDNKPAPGLRLFRGEEGEGDIKHSAKEVAQLLEPLIGTGHNPFAHLISKYINHPQWLPVDVAYDIAKNVRDKYDKVLNGDVKNSNEAVEASTLLGLQLLKKHAERNKAEVLLGEVNRCLPKDTNETKRPDAKRQEQKIPILEPPVELRSAVDRSDRSEPLKNSNMWKLIVGGGGAVLTAIGLFAVKDKFKTILYSIGTLAVGSVIGVAMNTGTKAFASTKTWIVGLGGLALTAIGYIINGEKLKSSIASLGTLGVGTLGGFTDIVSNFLTSSKDSGNREHVALSEEEGNPLNRLISMAQGIWEEVGVQLNLPQPTK